jgi:hypothetical protein
MKTYFRIPSFLYGIGLAIIRFEHKYVGTTNDGTEPFHKIVLRKFSHKRISIICYTIGTSLVLFTTFIMLTDTACKSADKNNKMKFQEITYCWGPILSALYNSFG